MFDPNTLYFVLVISNNLDGDLLKNILKALHDHFTNQSTFPAAFTCSNF